MTDFTPAIRGSHKSPQERGNFRRVSEELRKNRPFSPDAPRPSTTNKPEISRCTASVTSTVPGSAAACTPCGDIGSFAEYLRFVAGARTYHHRTRINANSCHEPHRG
jgi:hypothetical protein